jgi:hypothetical protein
VVALLGCAATLVHGDLKMANLGIDGDRLVLLDWGTLTTRSPAQRSVNWGISVIDPWEFQKSPAPAQLTELRRHNNERTDAPAFIDVPSRSAFRRRGHRPGLDSGRRHVVRSTPRRPVRTHTEAVDNAWTRRHVDGLGGNH